MTKASTVTMLNIPFTKDLATLLGTKNQAVERAKELIILGLYQESRISSGKAAKLLGLTRHAFISLLARKEMNYFQLNADEWAEEVATVNAWNEQNA